jgi:ribosomal protein S18 acetylase RimI-like enzyme
MLTTTIPLSIETYTDADYEGILELLTDCYAGIDDQLPSRDDMQLLASQFPKGQLVARENGKVAGAILSLLVRYDDFKQAPVLCELYNPANFAKFGKNGDSLFALEILVKSTHKRKGIGKKLNKAITKVLKENGLRAFIGVSRLPGYGAVQHTMSADEYIQQVVQGAITDPSLSYNCSNNMLPVMAIAGYYPPDVASAGYGALVIQQNKLYMNEQWKQLLSGQIALLHLPANSLLSDSAQRDICNQLPQIPLTYSHPGMPDCWGKAFENYLSMEEYLASHPQDAIVAELCNPIIEKITALLHNQGISVEPLCNQSNNQHYNLGNFRFSVIKDSQSMLHIDDLTIDGSAKPDFVLPEVLQQNPYVQLSVLIQLADKGEHTNLRIYHKTYAPGDNGHVLENGWQFDEAVVAGVPYTDFVPRVGDAFIMQNHFYHDILSHGADNEWLVYSTYILYVPNLNKAFLYI